MKDNRDALRVAEAWLTECALIAHKRGWVSAELAPDLLRGDFRLVLTDYRGRVYRYAVLLRVDDRKAL